MSQFQSRSTRLAGLGLATLMTVAIQGSLLLGFDAAARPDGSAPALAVVLPTVSIVAQRT